MRAAFPLRPALLMATAAVCIVTTGGARVEAQAGVREQTLFVSALNARGEPVQGLSPADFTITEDGRRREVLRVSPATEAIDIALLVDNSGAAARAIVHLRNGLRTFVTQMAVGNQIAIVALADRPTILVDYTSSQELLERGIGRLFAMSGSGMTLLDALMEVSAGLGRRDAPRAVVVPVITNGVEFTNRGSRDVVAALRGADAGLHAIVIGHLDAGSTEERERALAIAQGSKATGGQHVTLLTESAVEQALRKLALELSSQYRVVYGRPESLIPPDTTSVVSARTGVTMRGTRARGSSGAGA